MVVAAGTMSGPVIGIWLSMIALSGIKSGIAVALINTSPLILIPVVYVAYDSRHAIRDGVLMGIILVLIFLFLFLYRISRIKKGLK